jgi:hypothetical protein
MRSRALLNRATLVVATTLAFGSIAACTHPNDYYDVAYNDHHRWDSREDQAYRRWEAERRVEHVEFTRRNADDQRAYWTWRHSNPG